MLGRNEKEQFVSDGYVVVRGVFNCAVADQLVELVWQRVGENPLALSDAFRRRPQLEEVIEEGPVDALLPARLRAVVDELLGAGRWWTRRGFGWTIVRPPAPAGTDWSCAQSGWHVDGIEFQHRIDSPEQALVGIEMLTPSPARGGATVVRRGSHVAVARLLDKSGEAGLTYTQLRAFAEALEGFEAVPVAGEAGDVLLMNPFLVHARGTNVLGQPRVASNRAFSFHTPMRLGDPPPGGFNLVEQSIRIALALD